MDAILSIQKNPIPSILLFCRPEDLIPLDNAVFGVPAVGFLRFLYGDRIGNILAPFVPLLPKIKTLTESVAKILRKLAISPPETLSIQDTRIVRKSVLYHQLCFYDAVLAGVVIRNFEIFDDGTLLALISDPNQLYVFYQAFRETASIAAFSYPVFNRPRRASWPPLDYASGSLESLSSRVVKSLIANFSSEKRIFGRFGPFCEEPDDHFEESEGDFFCHAEVPGDDFCEDYY